MLRQVGLSPFLELTGTLGVWDRLEPRVGSTKAAGMGLISGGGCCCARGMPRALPSVSAGRGFVCQTLSLRCGSRWGGRESLRAATKPGDVCPGGCVSVRPLGTASSCPLGETEQREAGAKNSCPLPGLEVRQSGESPAAGWGGHGQCPELGTRDGGGILHVVLGPPSRPLAASFGVI